MWPDRVSNPGPLNYESGALSTALHVPASMLLKQKFEHMNCTLPNCASCQFSMEQVIRICKMINYLYKNLHNKLIQIQEYQTKHN